MVGVIYIGSGSDSDSTSTSTRQERNRPSASRSHASTMTRESSQSRTSVPDATSLLSSSPPPVVAFASHQLQDDDLSVPPATRTTTGPLKRPRPLDPLAEQTPRSRVRRLLADSSPDSSLPSIHSFARKTRAQRQAQDVSVDAESSRIAPAPLASSSRRIVPRKIIDDISAAQISCVGEIIPTSPEEWEQNASRTAARPRKLPAPPIIIDDAIEIGSDPIADPNSDTGEGPNDPDASSPIRSQFTILQYSSSQPLPLSQPPMPPGRLRSRMPPPPSSPTPAPAQTDLSTSPRLSPRRRSSRWLQHEAPGGAVTSSSTRSGELGRSKSTSAPIVILSSSPPRQSQTRSLVEALAESHQDSHPSPSSAIPIPWSSPRSPSSPTRPSPSKFTATVSADVTALGTPSPKRQFGSSRPVQRTRSLLDALDHLCQREDDRIAPLQLPSPQKNKGKERQRQDDGDQLFFLSQSTADGDRMTEADVRARGPTGSVSPSKPKQSKEAVRAAREAKARAREAAKLAKQREMADKKRWKEANRLRTSKAETIQEMLVSVDRTLFAAGQPLSKCEDAVVARLKQDGIGDVQVRESISMPPLLRFRRRLKAKWNEQRRHWVPLDHEQIVPEPTVIAYVDAKDIVQLVADNQLESWYVNLQQRAARPSPQTGFALPDDDNHHDDDDGGSTQDQHGERRQIQIFLIVQGLVKFYNRIRANENRAYTARIRNQLANEQALVDGTASASLSDGGDAEASGSGSVHSGAGGSKPTTRGSKKPTSSSSAAAPQSQVERALLILKFRHRSFVIHVDSTVDGVEWLHQLLGDLSMRPYKVLRDSHLSFAVDSGRGSTSSASPSEVWRMMLQSIPRVTPSIAESITTIYPSLRSLHLAYKACNNDQQRKNSLLATLQIAANKNGTERNLSRSSLGLQLSKRICAVFTSRNPDLLINLQTRD